MTTCNKLQSLPFNLSNKIFNRLNLKTKAALSIAAKNYENKFKELLKKEKRLHLKEKKRFENQIRFQNEKKS